MNKYINFHHYGLALKSFEDAIRFHKNLGYSCGKEIFDELQNVMLVLCTSNIYPTVELVKPLDKKTILDSVSKTTNLIVFEPGWKSFSISSEIIALASYLRSLE